MFSVVKDNISLHHILGFALTLEFCRVRMHYKILPRLTFTLLQPAHQLRSSLAPIIVLLT